MISRFAFSLFLALFFGPSWGAEKPNIVFILCDDLGYGDVHCLAPATSKIATPCADRLAAEGMTFTDAHSGSSVCTPTRYGIMTGRYSWRSPLQQGVVTGFAPCLISKDRPTVASFLRDQGYHTAIIGKWHLNFQYLDPNTGQTYFSEKYQTPPVGARIPDGPIHRGFDYYHGFHHARNMEAVIENDSVIAHDDVIHMLPRLTSKSVEYIRSRAGKEQPFFLYLPLGSPHTPIVPSPQWQGKSNLGKYGDFVMQTDHVLGEVSKALEENGLTQNTLLIFTSDNGCSKAAGIEDLARRGHSVSAHLRGSKADLWEGGHRVPFIVRWPSQVQAGSTNDQLICLTDFFATAGDLLGISVPSNSCEDSVSFLPALRGQKIETSRKGIIHHSISGHFAYREGNWKLALAKGSGGWSAPQENKVPPASPKAQLYDLSRDIGEVNNLYTTHPDIARRLLEQLTEYINAGRSTPGPSVKNDTENITLWKSGAGSNAKKKKNAKETSDSEPAIAALSPTPTSTAKRPNLLFIIADDQSPLDFKFYNPHSSLDAPVLEKLAAQGRVFDGAYHMGSFLGAVCKPSRHMIMTGRTLWRIRDEGKGRKNTLSPEVKEQVENCMASIFNRVGYTTMRTCKNGNSFALANQQFSVVRDATKNGPDDETGSAWHAQQVLDYLSDREKSQDTRPFLIYFGFTHPHDPRAGPPDLMAKYHAVNPSAPTPPVDLNSLAPALPRNYLEAHPFHHGHPNLRDEVAVKGVWEKRDEATIRNEIGRYFACSENIDRQIGKVLDKLAAMNELENTYIFYTADHGMAIGRHGLQGKQNLYEHTWRVPFIVKGPGIKPGRSQGNIYLLDVLGTLCDLAGVPAPSSLESISFKPVLEGKQDTVRDVLYGALSGGTKPGIRALRQGDWKLIKYDVLDEQVRETQLFNLKENPDEWLIEHHSDKIKKQMGISPGANQRNLANDPAFSAKRRELEALLREPMKDLDDPHPLWDQVD